MIIHNVWLIVSIVFFVFFTIGIIWAVVDIEEEIRKLKKSEYVRPPTIQLVKSYEKGVNK